jgi:multidrug efflux pump subunit AcrA (membrane-fusion protein)
METTMKTILRYGLAAALAASMLAAACRAKNAPEAEGGEPLPASAAGPVSVTLTPEAVASANLRTGSAAIRSVAGRISAAGELEWNARRVVHLTARTPGRLERVLAVRGDRVREGQLLAEIYSPEYLTLQAEFIQAAARALRFSGDTADRAQAGDVLAGARERLAVLGLGPGEIEAIQASGRPRPLLPVRAPLGGTVIQGDAVAGDAVDLGTSLFRLADPSTLWARLHIQEKDLGRLKAGAEVVLKVQAYPGEEFRGRLALLGDALDPATRTVEGRVEIGNPDGRLKAGMYVEGTATAGERRALVVPEEAVQDDEGRPIVFVKTGERTFARRPVETGERFAGAVEILKGLEAGETVVTSGSFLLKSEIRKGTLVED